MTALRRVCPEGGTPPARREVARVRAFGFDVSRGRRRGDARDVDLAQAFTNLSMAQRGFQANARTITSSDEMLQELVHIKR